MAQVHRNVVSCFLRHQNKIALFKRSDKVNTFQKHWAACSGSIEQNETPLQCAIREIGEETQLMPNEIQLVRMGRPFTVVADKTAYQINPFLFDITKKSSASSLINIDWEHDEFKFVDLINSPEETKSKFHPVVPQLWDGWDRVHINPVYEDPMEKIRNNLIDGAAPLTRDAMSILELFITEKKTQLTPTALKNFVFHLVNLRPTSNKLYSHAR